jgi:hypothetical protein
MDGWADAGGIPAISRWLSEATPPDPRSPPKCTPAGVPAIPREDPRLASALDSILQRVGGVAEHRHLSARGAGTPAGVRLFVFRNRWCRFAQPPANGFDPSGIVFSVGIAFPVGVAYPLIAHLPPLFPDPLLF